MECPQCRRANPPDAKFCGECGTRLQALCPACRAVNPAANNFCGECGSPLGGARAAGAEPPAPAETAAEASRAAPTLRRFDSPQAYTPRHLAEKILTSRGALEGERKQVTVLFTDVSGFTAMSERLDAEDVHAIMDRAFEVILRAVHRFEGTINQFLGDGVMALFGAPIAHEDHPHRALRAALAVQEELGPLRDEVRRTHGPEFRVRMGVNTGLVVVGAIGRDLRMDYTAVGDTTNLAARLLAIAQPGQIVVSEPTRALTHGYFELEDLGTFSVKGKSAPVRAFAVTRELRGRTRLEVSRERGLTPLAGRRAELARLEAAQARARAGEGAVAVVVGEPGVGKSRLLYEFLQRTEGSDVLELATSCLSHGRSIPYHPVLALVRAGLGVTDGMAEPDVRERLAKTLHVTGLEDDESAALVAHFIGLPVTSEFLVRLQAPQLKERTFQVLTRMLLRAGERRPVVVVVENLHWADESSLEFFQTLVAAVPGHRVLLLLSTRPGFGFAWLGAAAVETVTVSGLPTAELAGMVRALLGADEAAESLLGVLAEKSDGNPLYVEEILRELQHAGAVVVEDGRARLEASAVRVPATIHDMIAARVDRLPEALKETLQAAAVVGRQFPVDLVSAIAGTGRDLPGQLASLHDLDFVFPTEREPTLAYAFKHALTQEVVYSGLLERRRRVYHAAIGGRLEETHADNLDEIAELLAYHYARSAEAEKAVDYALRAAEKAQRRWAGAEALAHFDAALRRLDTMEDTAANRLRRIDAVVKQAEINFALGRHGEQVKALEQIKEIVAAADAPRRAAWYYWTGFLYSLTGAPADVSIAHCRVASDIAEQEGLDNLRAYAQCCLAHVYIAAGDLHSALKAGEWALDAFEAQGNLWWACRTLWALLPITNMLGEWHRALVYSDRAIQHATTMDDARLKVVAHLRRGATEAQRGDPRRALDACREAEALHPGPFDRATLEAVRGQALTKGPDPAAGIAQLEQAVAWCALSKLGYTRCLFALWLAEAYVRHGERVKARALADEALRTARERNYWHLEGLAARLLGESLLADDPDGAAEHLDAAAVVLGTVGARNDLAKVWTAQAALRYDRGDGAGGRALARRALALFEELGTLDEPDRVRVWLASLPPED